MDGLYGILTGIHNGVGSLTLLLTLVAAGMLLFMARTGGPTALVLRADLISASVQFLLGVVLIVVAWVSFGAGYVGGFWLHYLLGIVAVGVVSAVTARARRAPDSAARRYGLTLLGVVALVLLTFLVGQYQYSPFGA